MRATILWFWLLLLVSAKDVPFNFWGSLKATMLGCAVYVSEIDGLCPKEGLSLCLCVNSYAYLTMAGCLGDSSSEPNATMAAFIDYCGSHGRDLNMDTLYSAYAQYTRLATPVAANQSLSAPVRLNKTEIALYRQAYEVLYCNKDKSIYYGLVLVAYWLAVFFVAGACNLFVALFPSSRLWFNGKVSLAIRRYFTLPPIHKSRLLSKKSLGFIHYYTPSRLESFILIGFVGLTTGLCFVGYRCVEGDPLHLTDSIAMAHYAANRTGIMSAVLVPLVVLLAERNSLLQMITKWNHATFLLYHRWIARVTLILVVAHTALAIVKVSLSGVFLESICQTYLIWGTVGTVVGFFLFIHSLLWLRRKWYELFYTLHVVFGVIFLVSSWVHLAKLGYLFLMLIAIVIWIVERFIRWVRILSFGFPIATVTLCADETLRVEIPRPKYWKPISGGHGWLTFGSHFWQSHPFTLFESVNKEDTIVFLTAVKLGITKKMAEKIKAANGESMRMRVTVEGPYGESTPSKYHDSAVFIAGGNGFPGIFSEVYDLAKKTQHSLQKLKFYWIIRDLKSLSWTHNELKALAKTKIDATIYVTRPVNFAKEADSDSDELSDEKSVGPDIWTIICQSFPHIQFKQGRASIHQLVDREVEECMNSIAFISCGHPGMVDELRRAVVKKLGNTDKRVDCFEQLQSWA